MRNTSWILVVVFLSCLVQAIHHISRPDEQEIFAKSKFFTFGTNATACHSFTPKRFKSFLKTIATHPKTANYTLHPFFFCGSTRPEPEGITMITHISFEKFRIQHLKRLISHWQGPIALSIFARTHVGTSEQALQNILQEWVNETPAAHDFYTRVDVHLVLDHLTQKERRYPSNLMRDVALVAARTRFTLVMDGDIDFPLSMNDHLVRFLPALYSSAGRLVLPILTYELSPNLNTSEIRKGIPDALVLFERMANGTAYRACHYNQAGGEVHIWNHGLSNATTIPVGFHPIIEFNFLAMTGLDDENTTEEPKNELPELGSQARFFQVLGNISNSENKFIRFPLFNFTFIGRGYNRIAHTWELFSRGFRVEFAAGAFLTSEYHRTNDRYMWHDYQMNRYLFASVGRSISDRLRAAVIDPSSVHYLHAAYFTMYIGKMSFDLQYLELARDMFWQRLAVVFTADCDVPEQGDYERLAARIGIMLSYVPHASIFASDPIIELPEDFLAALYNATEDYQLDGNRHSAAEATQLLNCQMRVTWLQGRLAYYSMLPNIRHLNFSALSPYDAEMAVLPSLCECAISRLKACGHRAIKTSHDQAHTPSDRIAQDSKLGRRLLAQYDTT